MQRETSYVFIRNQNNINSCQPRAWPVYLNELTNILGVSGSLDVARLRVRCLIGEFEYDK